MSKRQRYKRRKFKTTSSRKLSSRDLLVLDFLWTWKVASLPMLKEIAYSDKSAWWAYKAVRQLRSEKYIELLPRGKNLDQELWALTEHGFEVVLMDRDDIKSYRYRVHAPAHDYLATCLQLGDLWQSMVEKRFLTEQMLASLSPINFPKEFREAKEHVPDGVTLLSGGLKEAIIGYEVDLNLKEAERYCHTALYYTKGPKAHLIVWLVRHPWMITKIQESISKGCYESDAASFFKRIAFVLVDDFKKIGWEAQTVSGNFKGETIRKLHANLLQSLGKDDASLGQKPVLEIFFGKYRSPQKLNTYKKGGDNDFY